MKHQATLEHSATPRLKLLRIGLLIALIWGALLIGGVIMQGERGQLGASIISLSVQEGERAPEVLNLRGLSQAKEIMKHSPEALADLERLSLIWDIQVLRQSSDTWQVSFLGRREGSTRFAPYMAVVGWRATGWEVLSWGEQASASRVQILEGAGGVGAEYWIRNTGPYIWDMSDAWSSDGERFQMVPLGSELYVAPGGVAVFTLPWYVPLPSLQNDTRGYGVVLTE